MDSDERRAREIAQHIFSCSTAEQTEAVIEHRRCSLTRFSASAIYQNTADSAWEVRVRCVVGRRVGCAQTNDISPEGLARATAAAESIARHQAERPRPVLLPQPASYPDIRPYSHAAAEFGAKQRAAAVRDIVAVCRGAGLGCFGSFAHTALALTVANTHGLFAHCPATEVVVNVLAVGEDSTGWAQFWSYDVAGLNAERLARRAADKALRSARPKTVHPGRYTVILEPEAVSDMLHMLAMMGLGARAFLEGRSFMCGKVGQRVCGENITLLDDAFVPENPGLPFDFEGVPRQRVELIRNGVARGVVWDTETAQEAGGGQRSTGHALAPPNTFGPFPLNLVLEPGADAVEQMVGSTERGLLVTRFHYTNISHPLRTVITGMTRDGTFLIERGEVVGGVRNLRFTQSVLEALSNVEMISAAREVRNGYLAPYIKVREFQFTGITEH